MQQTAGEVEGLVSPVILVSVTNMNYTVGLDTLHGLFARFGPIEKIVSFTKNPNQYKALVQYKAKGDAAAAISELHKRNMYEGCNTLLVHASHQAQITVRHNDKDRYWDFTVDPLLPPSPGPMYIGPGALPT
eukprot:Selendium_serpulae@DN10230_c0_g1_i1.p1